MKIEVLGPGCQKCAALAANVKAAADRLGLQYDLNKVTRITEFAKYGVMLTPALVIDGKVRLSGRAATEAEVTAILSTALAESVGPCGRKAEPGSGRETAGGEQG